MSKCRDIGRDRDRRSCICGYFLDEIAIGRKCRCCRSNDRSGSLIFLSMCDRMPLGVVGSATQRL